MTKTKYTLMLLLLATSFAAAAAPIAELETFKFTPDLQRVLEPIEKAVWQAKPADRANWEAKLLATLQSSKTTVDGKMIILRRLLPAVVSEKSVPVVAPILLDAKLADDARGVLQNYPVASAEKALLDALAKVDNPKVKLGLIQSLGLRRSNAASKPIAAILKSEKGNAPQAMACAVALGNIGTAKSIEMLLDAEVKLGKNPAFYDTLLIGCTHLAQEGSKVLSQKTLEYAFPKLSSTQKVAALNCLVLAAGTDALNRVVSVAKTNSRVQALLGTLPEGKKYTVALGDALVKQDALVEPGMLGLLVSREDVAAMPVVRKALGAKLASGDRDAAMKFIGQFGTKADLGWLLVEYKAGNKAAAAALTSLNADGVEDELIAKSKTEASLLTILAARNCKKILPGLIAQLKKPTDKNAFKAAVSVVPKLAGKAEIPALIDALQTNPKSTVTKVVVGVIKNIGGEDQIAALIAALDKSTPKAQGELLSALAQVGGKDALAAVNTRRESSDATVQEGATRALCSWSKTEAMGDLKALASSTKSETYKVLATRQYLTLAATQLNRRRGGNKTNVATIEAILPLCVRPDEKRMAISMLAKCYCNESIVLLKALQGDKEVARDAQAALKSVAKKHKPKSSSKKSRKGSKKSTSKAKTEPIASGKWVSLFDGKTLTGWERHGGKATYKVVDGAIVGTSCPRTPNTFLCSTREYGDFILEYEYFPHGHLNCGVQFRSKIRPQRDHVYGYQCEIDPSARAWSAGVYGEGGRGWLNPVECPKAKAAYKPGAWNKVRIVCLGHSIRTYLNGVPVSDMFDKGEKEGIIGLQVHGVGGNTTPMEIKWRNLRIMELKPADMTAVLDTLEDSMGKPAPRGATVLLAPSKGLEEWAVRSSKVKWMSDYKKGQLQWTVDKATGVATVGPKTGSMASKKSFGAQRIHIEFCTPKAADAPPEQSGNSGVLIQGRYELQICNSAGLEIKENYCGGLYKQRKPDVNAAKKAGEWQTYDIYFLPATFKDGKKTANARLSAKLNGQWIHRDIEIKSKTGSSGAAEGASAQPLVLQDHQHKVQFRNVWVCDFDKPVTLSQYDPRRRAKPKAKRKK
jgi:hypothetical protein